MRWMTRILLAAIVLVPILWVWPQRGMTTAFYANPDWSNRPAFLRVERTINLDFMTADSTSFPQQEFSVEWNGWLRTDRDGEYSFYTTSDDGSTIEIDGHVVVDNGGVHHAVLRTGTLATTRGLHRIRVRFLQTTGGYEFRAAWTPPGREEPLGAPGATVVRPQATCGRRLSDPPRLRALGIVLVRTRAADCRTDCAKRACDRATTSCGAFRCA